MLVVERHLEILLVGELHHALGEDALHFPVVAFEEGDDLLYLLLILLAAHIARAWRKALAQVEIEAGAGGLCKIARAVPHLERGVDEVGDVADVDGLHVRPEILRAVAFQPPHQADGGEILVHVHAQEGIGLVVLQQDVILGRVLLDEVVLGDESVHLARADDIAKIGDVGEHRHH